MELYLDTADVKSIRKWNEILRIDGVTTNPSILAKEKEDYLKVIAEISEILSDDQILFMQVVATSYEDILKEARAIAKLRKKNMYVKIPVTPSGLKAIKVLHEEGIGILATAIYSAPQAFLAAKNGADYLAPYVNRMDNYGDGIEEVLTLQAMLDNAGMDTKIIAASFKNVNQVKQLIAGGIGAVTVPIDVLSNMVQHPGTAIAVEEFSENWKRRFDEDKISFE